MEKLNDEIVDVIPPGWFSKKEMTFRLNISESTFNRILERYREDYKVYRTSRRTIFVDAQKFGACFVAYKLQKAMERQQRDNHLGYITTRKSTYETLLRKLTRDS